MQSLPTRTTRPHQQFTFTKEEENSFTLSFIGTLVQRNYDRTISVKIYRKPKHTNQYVKYTSQNPTSAKQSFITVLFDQADNVVSNENDKIEEKASHPSRITTKRLSKRIHPKNSQKAEQEKRTAMRAP